MAQIVINEISQNYTYNVGTASYCTVALPITSCWGPGFFDATSAGTTEDVMLEATQWQKFPATQQGLESFVSTFRGPAAGYRSAKDYSYQMAMTLLTSGQDVLVCRVCPGANARGQFKDTDQSPTKTVTLTAKYPGSFGNSIEVMLKTGPSNAYSNMIVYIVSASGAKTAVENIVFTFSEAKVTDAIQHVTDVESEYVNIVSEGAEDGTSFTSTSVRLTGGTDMNEYASASAATDVFAAAKALAEERYGDLAASAEYVTQFPSDGDKTKAVVIAYREWVFTSACKVYDLLTDKLAYNPNRIISPGWDDQDFAQLEVSPSSDAAVVVSPMLSQLMQVAAKSRCATALLDIPRSLSRSGVQAFANKLSEVEPDVTINPDGLFSTHSALFAPWGQYTYVGTVKQSIASPSFLALMIQRSMILNQPLQYEWALPTNRKHSLNIGKMDYIVPKHLLDEWQTLEGVGINVITRIPDLGTCLWGNSTLFNVPPATYQALANLSTRYLMNAVEDVIFRVGIGITFHYSNNEAYSAFYAGVTPILDTMKNVGAIEGYTVRMSADVNGTDQINANSVIGVVKLAINGVINDITVDLVALPQNAEL